MVLGCLKLLFQTVAGQGHEASGSLAAIVLGQRHKARIRQATRVANVVAAQDSGKTVGGARLRPPRGGGANRRLVETDGIGEHAFDGDEGRPVTGVHGVEFGTVAPKTFGRQKRQGGGSV